MEIYQPIGFTSRGERELNEDYLWPPPEQAGETDRLFVICDGVGGNPCGEVAAELAAVSTGEQHRNHRRSPREALPFINKAFFEYIDTHPEASGMATTMVYVWMGDETAEMGWIGDSRAYHIRDGRVLHRTRDHSLVNDLIDRGMLTEKQARLDPRKHMITRVIQAGQESPSFESKQIRNLQKGDYFFICSDGILERVDEAYIKKHFRKANAAEAIMDAMKERVVNHAIDNATAYLIKIKEV